MFGFFKKKSKEEQQKEVDSKYPGKYGIIPEVIRFCLSSELFKEVDIMLEETAQKEDMGDGSEEEFKLNYTDRHAAFVSNFEGRLEQFIVDRKCSVEEFYKMCSTAQEMGDTNIEAFVSILTQMLEFQSFMDLVRDPQKRAYTKQILAAYANMLTQ